MSKNTIIVFSLYQKLINRIFVLRDTSIKVVRNTKVIISRITIKVTSRKARRVTKVISTARKDTRRRVTSIR